MVSANCSREALLSQLPRSSVAGVDGVAVATSTGCKIQCDVLLQACVASTASRLLAAAPCAGLDLQLHCQVVQLSNQLSQGGAASTTAGSAVIIMNGRVSARMVANTLRFTVCSCKIACDVGSAGRDGSASERIRLWQDPSENRPQRRMRRELRESGTPRTTPRSAIKQEAASRATTARRRQRPHLATAYGPPQTLAIETGSRRPPATLAAPPNKEGSLSRRRPPEDRRRQHVPSADRELLPPADRGRPPIGRRRLARAEARHRSTSTGDGHDEGHARAS